MGLCHLLCITLKSVVVWWLARWTSDLKVGGSRPSACHCVVSLDKKLTLHSLSSQVYKKMDTDDILMGVTLDPLTGEVTIFSVAFCYRNRLRSCGPLWRVCDFKKPKDLM